MSKIKILFFVVVIIAVSYGSFFLYRYWTVATPVASPLLTVAESNNQDVTSKKVEAPMVESAAPIFGTPNFGSENFRVGDIAIGGEAELLFTEDTPGPLEISEVRGEAFTEKNKPEVKLIITWKTNKLAKSEISYSKGVGQTKKIVNENDFTINHNLIIPGLDQASTYLYTIVTRDRFGNETISDQHAIYTGTKIVSLFDLIAGAVSDVFGWAVNR